MLRSRSALSALRCAEKISLTVFALFIGVAMSITAFPVLARILTDPGPARKLPSACWQLTCARDRRRDCLVPAPLSWWESLMQAGNALTTLLLAIGFILLCRLLVASRGAQ